MKEGGIVMELISILALISLYRFLDTPIDSKGTTKDIYMDENEYCK